MVDGHYYVDVEAIFKLIGAKKADAELASVKASFNRVGQATKNAGNQLDRFSSITSNAGAQAKKTSSYITEQTARMLRMESELKKLLNTQARGNKLSKEQISIIKSLSIAYKQQGGNLSALRASAKMYNNTARDQVAQVRRVEARIKSLQALQARGIGLTKASAAELKRLNAQYMAMGGSMKMLNSGTGGGGLKGFLRTFTMMRWALVNVALAAAVVVGAWKAFGKPLIEMETEMAVVQKRTKMTGTELRGLKQELIDLSRTMPESATELAKLAGIAGQLGIRGTENIAEFTRVTAMMGAATVLTSEEAALALAKLSQAFDVPIKQVENMGSAVNELSNTTAANSKEISAAMLKMATSANQLGITSDMAAAVGATLVDMGMKAERAGTRMRAVFTRMSTETEKIARLYGDGTLSSDIEKAISEDANKAFLDLVQQIALTEDATDRVRVATEIFGRVGGSAVLGLASNFLDLKKNIVLASEEFKAATSLQEEFDIQMSTTAMQWKIMWGNMGANYRQFADRMGGDSDHMLKKFNNMETSIREMRNTVKFINEMRGTESPFAALDTATTKGREETLFRAELDPRKLNRIAKKYADDREKYVKTAMFLSGKNENTLTDFQRVELEFYFKANTEGWREAFDYLKEEQLKVKQEFDEMNTRTLSEGQINQAIEDFTNLNVALLKAEGSTANSNALMALNDEMEKYSDVSQDVQDRIAEEAEQRALLQERYATEKDELIDILQKVELYNEAQKELIQTNAEAGASVSEYEAELSKLKEEHKEAVSYLETYDLLTSQSTDSVDALAQAQKRASAAFNIANKVISEAISNQQEEYDNLKNARFKGEKEALEKIHQIELAIKKETLAQMDLKDAVDETNSSLEEQGSSYEAWVETVNQFITSTLSAGNKLGKNVSSTISRYQALLLSTSKFQTDQKSTSGTTSELTELEKLEQARERAQLEYDIGIGENKYQLQQYIDEVERGNEVELRSLSRAKEAIKDNWFALEALKSQQDSMSDKWGDAQDAVAEYESGLNSTTIEALKDIESQEDAVDALIEKYTDLIKKQKEADVDTGGSSRSSRTSDGYKYTLSDGTRTNDKSKAEADAKSGGTGQSTIYPSFTSSSKPSSSFSSYGMSSSSAPMSSYSQSSYTKPTSSFFSSYFDDFVMRPGAEPVAFSPDDTIIGVKDTGKLGTNITISNITINGASGDPEDFAYKFSRELERQLKTI